MKIPVTKKGLKQYDHLPPLEALAKAWRVEGIEPRYHRRAQRLVRNAMPLVARALDRLP